MIFCNIRTDFNFIFGKFSVARKLILNGGAIRPIGLLFSVTWPDGDFRSTKVTTTRHFVNYMKLIGHNQHWG